ncbi:RNA-directed DNA polymerase (Reverse transcriptase), Ribonuclease H-like protein [Gossypium australe]|uniref:RNA-directed DNA polymerase (Reverse transcriptase), Ribonuclease H-like protein n=1 Tax=Gossypium australe TaxID=47621 RepID=A0A5B6VE80_9ROSI|nr:RNA-directed DNA polymerase (Reverse transcriptase), Ribonuclease H-like protein [Gossypium australe]
MKNDGKNLLIKTARGMLGNLSINAIFEEGNEEENLSRICPYTSGNILNNWIVEEIPVVFFYSYNKSPDINDMSDTAAYSEAPFEQDMCLEEPQDFKNVQDCNVSPDLLRMVEKDEKWVLSHKESVLGDEQEKKEVKIRTCIIAETMRDLVELLQEFKDVFVWSYQDIPGLSTDIVVHKLPIKEEFPVPKKDGKVRICVDYKDLNKVSPKDNFSLPHIDTLVDNMINIHLEDMEKTTFVTIWGTFCYKVMQFGLKNAGITY